jgi:hypothetical protein
MRSVRENNPMNLFFAGFISGFSFSYTNAFCISALSAPASYTSPDHILPLLSGSSSPAPADFHRRAADDHLILDIAACFPPYAPLCLYPIPAGLLYLLR